jgi:hypothetical protein
MRSSRLACQTKLTIYKTLMRPVLLYGIVKRGCSDRDMEENLLLVIERKVLRTICGQKIVDDVYRSRRRNQRRPKSRWADGMNSDSRALGPVTERACKVSKIFIRLK